MTKSFGYAVAVLLVSVGSSASVRAQLGGNARDLTLSSGVESGLHSEGAKLLRWGQVLNLHLDSPGGSLTGMPAMLAVDLGPRTANPPAVSLPGEPNVIGLSTALFFAVEGTGSAPAYLPGPYTIPAGGFGVGIPVPDLSPLGPISLWIQGATLDPGAPNGFAFTRTIRHDSELLPQQVSVTATEYQPGTLLGYGLSAADVNGDGYDDIVAGLPNADPNGVFNAGEARVYFGPGLTTHQQLLAPQLQGYAWFGNIVRAADVNGDQHVDILVGAREENDGAVVDAGAAYIFFGPSFTSSVRLTEPVPEAGARFGHAIAVTDWDGDGVNDVAIGAHKATSGGFLQSGEVFVFKGPSFNCIATLPNPYPAFGVKFGYTLAGGDFNRDGFGDLAVGAPYHSLAVDDHTGTIALFYGPYLSPVARIEQPLDLQALMGNSIAVTDFDRDGFLDLAIGAEFDDQAMLDAGSIHIAYGPSFTVVIEVTSPEPSITGGFGSDVAVGDLNADGFPDIVAGEFYADPNGLEKAGRAWAILGPTFDQHVQLVAADAAANAQAGRRVACGDTNGDGFADAIFGAPQAGPGGFINSQEGAIYIAR